MPPTPPCASTPSVRGSLPIAGLRTSAPPPGGHRHDPTIPTSSAGVIAVVERPLDTLDLFRQDAQLTRDELWLRYFELGVMSTAFEVEACLHGALEPSAPRPRRPGSRPQ